MSQHFLETTCNNHKVNLVVGWDRPLQIYFMSIDIVGEHEDATPCPCCGKSLLYHYLEDAAFVSKLGSLESKEKTQTMDYFIEKLAEFNLTLPSKILDNLHQDKANDVGNHFVRYWYDGDDLKSKVLNQ